MIEPLDRLAKHVYAKLRVLGFTMPTASVLRALLDTAYIASIKTEENRFVRGSLTFSDPKMPEPDAPILRRADYPSFTPFGKRTRLDANAVVKFSRAVDRWSGSLAVFGTARSNLFVWGVVDQLVGQSIRQHREAGGGFDAPGVVTINIEGVGDISVYHGDLFLGRLRQNDVIVRENDALRSPLITSRIVPAISPLGASIARVLAVPEETDRIIALLFRGWSDTVARICIGLRRLGTGGSLLITAKPATGMLQITHAFRYSRLSESTILNVLDNQYLAKAEWESRASVNDPATLRFARADAKDRADELTGAVKVATALAATDGVLLLDLFLGVLGFGVKIGAGNNVRTIYSGPEFMRKGREAKKIDPSHFGTRHGSMLRYCWADRDAIGIVVSQDGHTRLIAASGQSLTMWDDVKLLRYHEDVGWYARMRRRLSKYRKKHGGRRSVGYTIAPKTVRALLSFQR